MGRARYRYFLPEVSTVCEGLGSEGGVGGDGGGDDGGAVRDSFSTLHTSSASWEFTFSISAVINSL